MTVAELRKVADKANRNHDFGAAVSLYSEALEQGPLEASLEYELRSGRAESYFQLGDFSAAAADLAAMTQLATNSGSIRWRILATNRQVEALRELGRLGEALELADAGAALARDSEDPDLEADSLITLGRVYERLTRLDEAQGYYFEALSLYRQSKSLGGQARALSYMGDVARRTGQSDKANDYFQEALLLNRHLNDQQGEAYVLNSLGLNSTDLGRQRTYHEQALAIYAISGNTERQTTLYNNLALLYWNLGLFNRARQYAEQAVQIARESQARASLVVYLDGLGRGLLSLGLNERAAEVFAEGRHLSRELGSRADEAASTFGLGQVALAQERAGEARDLFAIAAKLFAEVGAPAEAATVRSWEGMALLRLGDAEAAVSRTAQAIAEPAAGGEFSTEYPPQDVWWHHYRALMTFAETNAEEGTAGEEAWQALDRAGQIMLANMAGLSDVGLRRNYLNKVTINREIVSEWLRQAEIRSLSLALFSDRLMESGELKDQLTRLLDIGIRLNARRPPAEVPRFIMDEVVELSGAERALLILKDDAGEQNVVEARFSGPVEGIEEETESVLQEFGAIVAEAEERRQAIIWHNNNHAFDREQRSVLCVPLIAQENVLGLIYADLSGMYGRFTTQDRDLLVVLANQAAVAVENAEWARTLEHRVDERTADLLNANITLEQRAAELATVNTVSQALVSEPKLDALIALIGEQMRQIFRADVVYVALRDLESDWIRFPFAFGEELDPIHFGEGLTSRIIESGRPLLINADLEDRSAQLRTELIGTEAKSYLGVPIIVKKEPIGVISVQSTREEGRFDEDDLRLLTTIAANVGAAIQNARLFEETQRQSALAEEARSAAEAANRAKSAFLAKMSHELRTPLNAIIGFTRIVKRQGRESLPDKQLDNLDKVLISAEHLLALINAILDIAKIESGHLEVRATEFDVAELIDACGTTSQPLLRGEQVRLRWDVEDGLPRIYTDPDKVRQILLNLLSNAAKFTHQGEIVISASRRGRVLRVLVEDTGIGISEEALPRIFEEFEQAESTTNRQYGGTGLGLSISRSLARLLGGDLTATSLEGVGSTFTMTLPMRYGQQAVMLRASEPKTREAQSTQLLDDAAASASAKGTAPAGADAGE
jgi:signal transduction histidine kinase